MQLLRLKGIAAALAAAAAIVGSLVVTPAAGAAIAASQITTPTDPTYLVSPVDPSDNHPTDTFDIAGTTTGGTTGDHVDVLCYFGDTYNTVATSVPVNQDGSFSVPAASEYPIWTSSGVCRLRAVPAGTTPADVTPFAGPRVLITGDFPYPLNGGPNNGLLSDYYVYAQQLTGAFDYVSVGDCGLLDGYLFDPTFAVTTYTFNCDAGLFMGEAASPTRSELQIDGANAYAPYTASLINTDATGFPAVTYSYTVDPATGNTVIHEADPLVTCSDSTYPPSAQSCSTFVSTGVTDNVTITQDHDGHIAWFTEAFTSTDGHQHSLDLLWDNTQRFHLSTGDASQLEYEFPGESSYSTHAVGDSVSLPASPGAIFIRMHGAADGDPSTGQGAIVYDRPASSAAFNYVSTASSTFTLHQTGTVPAGGAATFKFAYVQDYLAANVASLTTTALNTIAPCVVPAVKGKRLSAAKHALAKANCTAGRIKKAHSTRVKRGRVISSKPKAGKHLAYLAKVGLVVSSGPKK